MATLEQDIKKYLHLVNKRKLIFVITAVSITTIFIIVSYLLPSVYEASSTVFIEKNVINRLIKGIAISPSMEDRLRVLSYSMTSRELLLKVLKALGIDINTDDRKEVERVVREFQKNTTIDMKTNRYNRREMDLFIVSFRNRKPELAKDYVNTLVRMYVEENLSAKRKEAFGANRFLSGQIKFFKDKLDKIDAEIVNFRKDRGIFIAVDEGRIVEEIKGAREKLEELKIQRMELEAKGGLLEMQLKAESPYTVAILGRRGNTLNDRLIMLQAKLNELLVNYTENYPEVLRVKAEIESLKEMIRNRPEDSDTQENAETEMSTLNPMYQQLKEASANTKIELASLSAKEDYLKGIIESKKAYLRNIPAEKKKLADLEREKASNKKIYEELVYRLGQSEVSNQMELQNKAATFRIVDSAVLPIKPVSPNRMKIILLGIFAGLAGGFGFVMLLDYMDNSVKSVGELKPLDLPILAVIPTIQDPEEVSKRRKKDIVLYTFAGLYMLCVLGIFAMEFMGLTYIEDFVKGYLIR